MSGGISAIKGFAYQATVILDRLFDHFDQHGPASQARPEGIDDLDLSWSADGAEHLQHIQIKKPREDIEGNLNPSPWTLSDAVGELLPNTINHLWDDSRAQQIWIVGDEIYVDVSSLVSAGLDAPVVAATPYWKAMHGLVRNAALETFKVQGPLRKSLLKWRVPEDLPSDPREALARLVKEFGDLSRNTAANGEEFAAYYHHRAEELHARLPSILFRTKILTSYGSESDVAERVCKRLEQQYELSRSVIENTLLRNLLGFITDISKQPGRKFNLEEFEFELRNVWPHMIPIREAPPLEPNHLPRPDLEERFTTGWAGKALEVVGISGSGKTMLAAAVAQRSATVDPHRGIYYAEVRPGTSLRDVLAGVGFHIRRAGISQPFAIAIDPSVADEEILRRLARSYSTIPKEILLLVDLVEGSCSNAFARDLATFIRALESPNFRPAILSQESALRELTALERDELGANRLDIPGFHFEEFITLVRQHHSNLDRALLQDIYNRVTAGRAAGLFARLAHSLARTGSLEEMSQIAARPPNDMLAHAEQQRYARMSEGARSAAAKLVCFALPFRRADAKEVFPDDDVGAAIRELSTQGLLRSHGSDSFEMHETVRAGLEETLAPNTRRSAHEALAHWYRSKGFASEEIHHLEKAGKPMEAHTRAREAFLGGRHWASLSSYVLDQKLVTAAETVAVITGGASVEDIYLLPGMLRILGPPIEVDPLFELLRTEPERFRADYNSALAITEAILDFEPTRLHDLVLLVLEHAGNPPLRDAIVGWLRLAIFRRRTTIESRTIEWFKRQPPEVQEYILPLLLVDCRRESLQPALAILAAAPKTGEGPSTTRYALDIRGRADVIEFLAAMPAVTTSAMVNARSPLLGSLADLVWPRRGLLREHCIGILRDRVEVDAVLVNAIRVLAFVAEPSICALCDPFLTRKDALGVFARVVPALVPASLDRELYEARLLDPSVAFGDRVAALLVMSSVGIDLDDLYGRVKGLEGDTNLAQRWDLWFLMACVQTPFSAAIPLLERSIVSKNPPPPPPPLITAALTKLSEQNHSAATNLLITALGSTNPLVRTSAALGLQVRRSRPALRGLLDYYTKEKDDEIAVVMAAAIVASGPQSTSALEGRPPSRNLKFWQLVLAMRLRDATVADELVQVANDSTQHWQLRRLAILAAGRLPYELALEHIAPVVMAEQSPLTTDRHIDLICHSVLSATVQVEGPYMAQEFIAGRDRFVNFWADLFEVHWRDLVAQKVVPSGTEISGWLYDRLAHHGWPARSEAPDLLLNELHIPILQSAVLRSLRLCGQPELIEELLSRIDHAWLAMKCLQERSRCGKRDDGLVGRLRQRLGTTPCAGNVRLERVIIELCGPPAVPFTPTQTPPPTQPDTSSITFLTYDEAVVLLSARRQDFKPTGPVILAAVTAEQCEHLILLADPANDRNERGETFISGIRFSQQGHLVAERRVTHSQSSNALIRPAIAAANRFGLMNPWHGELMTGILGPSYLPGYIACLGVLNDADRFYQDLAEHEDALFSYLCDAQRSQPVLKYVDVRMVPHLSRYISSGNDQFFEGLCTLAARVTTPEIDNALAGLLNRWTQRFDLRSLMLQHDENHALWRGFRRLTQHPRFESIERWRASLATVLSSQIAWYRAEDIVRVIDHNPRSYILIEQRVFKTANWQHRRHDEIDQLDDAAESLFPQMLEA